MKVVPQDAMTSDLKSSEREPPVPPGKSTALKGSGPGMRRSASARYQLREGERCPGNLNQDSVRQWLRQADAILYKDRNRAQANEVDRPEPKGHLAGVVT